MLVGFLAVLGLLVVVVVFNGMRLKFGRHQAAKPDAAFVDDATVEAGLPSAGEMAGRLGRMLAFKTISESSLQKHRDLHRPAFIALHRALEEMYPLTFSTLSRELVNGQSLLLVWQGVVDTPGILLMAHQDVVPVESHSLDRWKQPPFSGAIADGFVWGRGSIDMKGQLMAILEAVEALLRRGFKPHCPVYLFFGHDEEIDGQEGAAVAGNLLRSRGVRLSAVLDEGGAVGKGYVPGYSGFSAALAVTEKQAAHITLTAKGKEGHASRPGRNSAMERLCRAAVRLADHPMPANLGMLKLSITSLGPSLPFVYRLVLGNLFLFGGLIKKLFGQDPETNAMMRTTLAPTVFQAGTKDNVIPGQASLYYNCRMMPGDDLESVLEHIRRVIGDDSIEISSHLPMKEKKPVADLESPYYNALVSAIRGTFGRDIPVFPTILSGATDSRYMTGLGGQIYLFQPIRFESPEDDLTHKINERVRVEDLPAMVAFMIRLIRLWDGAEM